MALQSHLVIIKLIKVCYGSKVTHNQYCATPHNFARALKHTFLKRPLSPTRTWQGCVLFGQACTRKHGGTSYRAHNS